MGFGVKANLLRCIITVFSMTVGVRRETRNSNLIITNKAIKSKIVTKNYQIFIAYFIL